MDTNCASRLADICLYSCEAEFIQSLLFTEIKHFASRFNLTDTSMMYNPELDNYLGRIYSAELDIKDPTESITPASYLDIQLSIGKDGHFTLPFTTNEMISISTSQTFRFWVEIFCIFAGLWYFYLSTYTIRPGLLLVWMFYSEGQATFQ